MQNTRIVDYSIKYLCVIFNLNGKNNFFSTPCETYFINYEIIELNIVSFYLLKI